MLDEMFATFHEEEPPLFVRLAGGLDRSGDILESVLRRLETDTMARVLDLIKEHLDKVIPKEAGKHWIKGLSQRVNSAKTKQN